MPTYKRIPVVVSHYSDSSSEDEGEVHSTSSSVSSGQLYTTPSTELPEIHSSNFSCSSSSDYEDLESSFTTEKMEAASDIIFTTFVEKDDSIKLERDNSIDTLAKSNQTQLSNHLERVSENHETSSLRGSQVIETSFELPRKDCENGLSVSSYKNINLLVHISDEDMDISENESIDTVSEINARIEHCDFKNNEAINTYPSQQEEEIAHDIKKCGAILSKYCILKLDRLYCNFNPSEKRGCQIHFPKDSILDLVQHLELFHGIDCNLDTKTVHTNYKFTLERKDLNISKNVVQVDSMSVSSVEEALYNDKVNAVKHITPVETENDYDPENDFIEPFVQVNPQISEDEESQEEDSVKNVKEDKEEVANERIKTKADLKREKRKNQPFVSRVTPKLLRSRTTPEITTSSLPKTRSKSKIYNSSKEEKRKVKPSKITPITSDIKSKPLRKTKKEKDSLTHNSELECNKPSRPKHIDVSVQTSKTECEDVGPSIPNTEQLELLKELKELYLYSIREPQLRGGLPVESEKSYIDAGTQVYDTDDKTSNSTCNISVIEFEQAPNELTTTKENDSTETIPQSESSIMSDTETTLALLPSDPWPLTLGFGFFTKNKYYCNANRSLGSSTCCRAILKHISSLIQHLDKKHQLDEKKAEKLRENEESEYMSNEIANFIFANNVVSDVVEDESFKKMMASMRGCDDDSLIMPSAQHIRQLLHGQYSTYEDRIKRLLKGQRGLSFVIQVWKPDFDPDDAILIITAMYLNTSWKTKEVVVAFRNLPRTNVAASAMDSIMEAEFNEVIQNLDVKDEYHSVFISNLPSSHLTFKTNGIEKPCAVPCLDVILEFAHLQLFTNLENQLPSFKKVSGAHSVSKSSSKKLTEVSSTLLQAFERDRNTSVTLENIPSMIEKFNLICISNNSLKKFTLNRDDRAKIKKFAGLNETLKKSLKWLDQSTTSSLPIASKALVTCLEILDSLILLAECYGIKGVDGLLNEKEEEKNQKDSMETLLRAVFILFHQYKLNVEKGDNPLWKALVLDTFSFAAYSASINANQLEYNSASVSEVSAAFSVQIQAFELEQMLGGERKQNKDFTAPNSPTPTNDATSQTLINENVSAPSNQVKRKRSDDNLLDTHEQVLRNSFKKNCVKGITSPSTDFQNHIYQFKKDQYKLLISSGTDYMSGKKVGEYNLLSNEAHNRQIRFWEDVDENYYPDVARLTKKSYTVPITRKECLRALETIKVYYTGLKLLNPSADLVEIQEKALVYSWKKKNGITVD